MTINSYDNRRTYAGNGSTTVFSFPPPFTSSADLVVQIEAAGGAITTMALGTDYTASSPPYTSGGTVTMATAPVTGATLIISRNVPITQSVDLQDGGPLPAGTVNGALDRITMWGQRLMDIAGAAMGPGSGGRWDARGRELSNAADATTSTGLVTLRQLSAAFDAAGIAPPSGYSKHQIVLALADTANPSGANVLPNFLAMVDPLAGNDGSAQWLGNGRIFQNDAVATIIQSATAWSGAQMAAFFSLASTKPA